MGEKKQSGISSSATSGWTSHVTEDGKKYYYNKATKKSVWKEPPNFKVWDETFDKKSKRYFYFNRVKNVSSWKEPVEDGVVIHRCRKQPESEEKRSPQRQDSPPRKKTRVESEEEYEESPQEEKHVYEEEAVQEQDSGEDYSNTVMFISDRTKHDSATQDQPQSFVAIDGNEEANAILSVRCILPNPS